MLSALLNLGRTIEKQSIDGDLLQGLPSNFYHHRIMNWFF